MPKRAAGPGINPLDVLVDASSNLGTITSLSGIADNAAHMAATSLGLNDQVCAAEPKPSELPGFRHFLENPGDGQRFTLDGKPFDPSKSWARAEELMRKLAELCMVPPATKVSDRDNRSIPSGYTYLLQLVAHDLVNSSLLLSRNKGRQFGLANVRDLPLRLETIYGGGPAQCPHAYQSDRKLRHRLRVGKMRKTAPNCAGTYDLIPDQIRDLARGTPGTAIDFEKGEYSEPYIADPRNDSHAIISQMVVLFHMLHNTIEDRLNDGSRIPRLADSFANTKRTFIAAHLACVLIYRSIIRHDLLPKILHPAVRAAYETGSVKIREAATRWHEWRAPLELTHGFLRFAHAMIRPTYSLNALTPPASAPGGSDGLEMRIHLVLGQSSEKAPAQMPFDRLWIIDWPRFFGESAVNFSLLIEPWPSVLLEAAVRDHDDSSTLIERDLLSSIAVQPWSIGAMVKELQSSHGDLLKQSPFLTMQGQPDGGANRPPWYEAMSQWMTERASRYGNSPTPSEIDHLACDPPIPFFVRFEAGLEENGRGKHLGILGSIVLADVIYGIFEQDPIAGIDWRATLAEQLTHLSKDIFNGCDDDHQTAFAFLDEMDSFPQVLKFLTDQIQFPAGD